MRFVTRDGCAPLTDSPSATCRGYHDWASAQMRAPEVTTVVISVNWAGEDSAAPIARGIARPGIDGEGLVRGRMAAEIRGLVARHKRVIVILSNPMGWQLEPQNMISRVTGRIAPQPLPLAEFLDLHGESLAALRRTAIASGAEVIDPLPALCPNAICPSATEDGRPLYQHDGHLRPFFARDRATYIDRVLE